MELRSLKIVITLLLVSLVAGCKLAVMVGSGGSVESVSSGNCDTRRVCVYEISNTSYSESFTAVPDTGWQFVKWNEGGNFLCENATSPTCVVSNTGFAGNAGVEAIVASNVVYYIQPIFSNEISGADIVTVSGREWLQPELFKGLSWDDVNAVCPVDSGGVCSGTLNDYSMNGWTWASVADANELFNFYFGSPFLGSGPDFWADYDQIIIAAMTAAGWRATRNSEDFYLQGTIALVPDGFPLYGGFARVGLALPPAEFDFASTTGKIPREVYEWGDWSADDGGAFFYRD